MGEISNTEFDDLSPRRLLVLVAEMAEEIHPRQNLASLVSLEKSLERDLGFDSLSRMELLQRIEREFNITLSERALTQSDTPAEILAEIGGHSTGVSLTDFDEVKLSEQSEAEAAPEELRTLNDILKWHAATHPERIHIHLYSEQDEAEIITYSELLSEAEQIAAGLIKHRLTPSESVLLMLPTSRNYFISFFGVLLAGGIPVPIYPPGRSQQLEEHLLRHAKIAERALAGLMITVVEAKMFSHLLVAQVPSLRDVITCEDLMNAAPLSRFPEPDESDTVFLQFTSGSTGDPKGVVLSHANLVSNIQVMGKALGATSKDVFVSWLPLYHDMGLIGAWLGSLVHATPLVIMSPLSFLARPQRWLQAIQRYGGTISGAPNFAYEACVSRIRDEDIEGLELSSWRVAFNGAEAVSPKTIAQFEERFAKYGFRAEAMTPVYGLAENSVGLAFPPLERGPRIDTIERETFMKRGRAVVAEGSGDAIEVPSSGKALPGHQIRVIGPSGYELPERQEGRVQFHGPSASAGYFRNPDATADLLAGEWRNAGDLGYMADGEIFITGRQKDLIIRAGRNIFPAELEEAVGSLDGIQKGSVAVFGSPDSATGTECLVVMAESRRRNQDAQEKLNAEIRSITLDLTGTPPDAIELVPLRTVPKTSSGKIRRQSARAVFEQGIPAGKSRLSVKWQIYRMALAGLKPSLQRVLHSSIAWSYAAYMYLLMAIAAPFTWIIVAVLPGKKLRFAFVRAALGILWWLGGIKILINGYENIPKGQRFLFTVNHASYIDGPVLVSALPGEPSFVAKSDLVGNFFSRIFLNRLGSLFVERFKKSQSAEEVDEVIAAIEQDRELVYFPEGTFTRMTGLLPFQMGAFTTAIASEAAIVPIAMRGTRSILRDNTGFPRPGNIHIKILPAITTDRTNQDWQAAIELRNRVRNAILEHCGEPDLAHEHINPLHLKAEVKDD